MALIVLHHYCVNSGLIQAINMNDITCNTVLIQFMAIWGKVGVNGFFILSGYFMVDGIFKVEKLCKLVSEVLFYNILVTLFLLLLGYDLGLFKIVKCVVPVVFDLPETFTGSYLLVYILSPAINVCIKAMGRKRLLFSLCVLLVYFSVVPTFLFRDTWNYFGWGVVMYSVGGFIKLHNDKVFDGKFRWLVVSLLCVAATWLSILAVDFVGVKFGFHRWTHMIADANKLPMFVIAVSMFLLFKNLTITNSRAINTVAASTFGVFLIHANSDVMRRWLWVDSLKNVAFIDSNLLPLHMAVSVVSVYSVCTIIDICRIKLIERPFFCYMQRAMNGGERETGISPSERVI